MSWDRVAVAALPLLLPVGLLAMMLGQTVWPLVAVGAAELGLIGLARRSDRRVPDGQWFPPSSGAARTHVAPRRGSPVLAIAGVEIRELLLSAWFQAGVAFCAVFLVGITSYERSWWGTAALMPLLVHPLCGFALIAAHRNVSRARRDATTDIIEACPVSTEQRNRGHLVAGVVPVLVASAFVAVSLVGTAIVLDDIYGPLDARVAADVVIAGALLPFGATALGVVLGRRFPAQIVPIVALAVIAIVNLEFWDEPDGRGWLATGLPSPANDLVYIDPPNLGRLAWLAGLVAIVAIAAGVVRRGRVAVFALSGGAIVAIGGIVLTALGPSDATAQRLADYVLLDDSVTERTDVSGAVEVCVPEPYGAHGTTLAEWVSPVAEALPVPPIDRVRMWLLADDIDRLQGAVRARLEPTPLPPGVIALPFGHHDAHLASARFGLAAAAVGIPVGPDAPQNVLVGGQARGVVMLWLLANELDEREIDRLLTPQDSRDGASYRGHLWPGICGADVQWSPQDVEAARTVVALDRGEVADLLATDWVRWVDPATSTDDLLVAFDLPGVGPPEPIEPLGDTCS